MQERDFGQLGKVSALTLGGGGIGQVWGTTSRDEAVATVRRAVDAGITWLDMAPSYGDGEAERVVGAAFEGDLPAGVRISTKYAVRNVPIEEVVGRIRGSLDLSMQRMRIKRVDALVLHGDLRRDDRDDLPHATPRRLFIEAVRPAFEALVADGLIGAWGITGIGEPSAVIDTVQDSPAPTVIQCIANLIDSPGGIQRYPEPARPREVIAAAAEAGVGVMGIRAVQAGALTDAIDRPLPDDHPDVRDYNRAAAFRSLASELGVKSADLAHRYALAMPGVSTVVLGVKNREELEACLRAEAAGPLEAELVARVDALGLRTN
jgi:aryl-alcohol dehydrogenase-like predicted oxidoreductase